MRLSSRSFLLLGIAYLPLLAQKPLPEIREPRDFDVRRPLTRPHLGGSRELFKSATGKPASKREAASAARDVLRAQIDILTGAEVDRLRLVRTDETATVSVVHFRQTIDGLDVYQGDVRLLTDADGRTERVVRGNLTRAARLSGERRLTSAESVRAAYSALGVEGVPDLAILSVSPDGNVTYRNPAGDQFSSITPELIAFPVREDEVVPAWRLYLEIDGRRWYEIVVGAANGRLLVRHNLYRRAAQGRVWKESPLKGPRELAPFPESWIGAATVTNGNNVDAYLDRDGNNAPDAAVSGNLQAGRASSATQTFDFPAVDTGLDPRQFAASAVTQLFYLVNTAHDYFYGLGFTETAGNFQADNLGKGGKANDAVLAEAHDIQEVGNASFAPTPEGIRPRLQVGIETRETPAATDDLDLSLSGHTVVHEYAHGVTARLIGGVDSVSCLFGTQSDALAEGWSDYFAISFYGNPVFDGYGSANVARGARRQSYEGYTFTYEDLGNTGFLPHDDGEIWAATLWDLRKSLGAAVTDRLVYNALKLTPCNPSMIAARDAIIAADQTFNAGANRARLWAVFARHGMGFSANGTDGDFEQGTVFTAAFDQPADLHSGNRGPVVTSLPPNASFGTPYVYQIAASDPDGGRLTFTLNQGPAGMTIDSETGVLRWQPIVTGDRVKVTITDGQGGRAAHGFYLTIDTGLTPGAPVVIAAPAKSEAKFNLTVPAGSVVLQVTTRGAQGDVDIYVEDPDGLPVGLSTRDGSTETLSIPSPKPGRWRIVVFGYTSYSGIRLTASLPVPALLSANGFKRGLSGDESSEIFYRIIVPPGSSALRVNLTDGSGDADLYIRSGRVPVCQFSRAVLAACLYDQRSENAGNFDSVIVGSPTPGDWYITLSSYQPYSGVTLATTLSVPPTLSLSTAALDFVAVAGGTAPAPREISVLNARGLPFTWRAVAAVAGGGSWLRIDKTTGTADGTIMVSVDPSGLAAGVYRGAITITAPDLAGSPRTIDVVFTVTARPVLSVAASSLTFSANAGEDPAPQTVAISIAAGSSVRWSASVTTGGSWLAVDPASGTGNGSLRVTARAAALAAGSYSGAITITADAGNSPVVIQVALTLTTPVSLTSAGVFNGGSFVRSQSIAEGEILSLFGSNLTDSCSPCPAPQGYPLPVQLGSTRVTINGTPAPLHLALPGQINLIVPFGLTGSTATIVVWRGSVASVPITVNIARQSIGILSALGNGVGAGVILHADGTLVSATAPLRADEVVIVYLLGLGPVSPSVVAGEAAPASPPLAETTTPMQALLDGVEGRILFSGLAPNFAGLYQMNINTPAALDRKYPSLVIRSEFAQSNEVSAGGPSVLDISPARASSSADLTVTLRGLNFSAASVIEVGGEAIATQLTEDFLQSLTATIPARLVSLGQLSVRVRDSGSTSNAVAVTIQP